jgi:isocitrate/isopropylmalate dehydrogenase
MNDSRFRLALLADDERCAGIFSVVRELLDGLGGGIMYTEAKFGKAACAAYGGILPEETVNAIAHTDAALLGLIDKTGASLGSPLGKMRKRFSLYADVRPVLDTAGNFDLVFIRETTEGFLADRNCYKGQGEFMPTADTALSLRVVTRAACLKIARFAFDYAVKHGRKAIIAAHKKNIFALSCGLFLDCFYETAKEYPGIRVSDDYVDAIANGLVMNPGQFDVILTTNLFGDIISDLGSGLVNNLCAACNVSDNVMMVMPVNHSIGPDEKNLARFFYPYMLCAGEILSACGKTEVAKRLGKAVRAVYDPALTVSEAAKKIKETVL